MALELDIGFSSHIGKKDINEDFCSAVLPDAQQEPWGSICAVADGVSAGGHGQEAARTAVKGLLEGYYDTPEGHDVQGAMQGIISVHNTWLRGVNQKRAPESGLTTLTALVLRNRGYTVAHVGDSRAYLLRDGQTILLTTDHVSELPHMQHQLRRAIGAEHQVQVDFHRGQMQPGDVFMLVTDGVHGMLDENRLAVFTQEGSAQEMSQRMVDAAVNLGGQDNASAVVVQVLGTGEDSQWGQDDPAQLLHVPPRLQVGEQIDALEITAVLADNNKRLVYQVRDPQTQRLYVLKTLNPQLQDDADERAILAHEQWLATHLQTSPAAGHLVHLHATPPTRIAEYFYLLYDWHAGESLQQMLDARGKLGVEQAVSAVTHALNVLALLHDEGVIHRDIRPANLHWGSDGVLRLLDMGVALSGQAPEVARAQPAGMASYVNPEQYGYSPQGDKPEKSADTQSDLYALGVTLYQLLTGKLPFGELQPYQTARYAKNPVAPSRHNPTVPDWLDQLVLRAVSRSAQQRFANADQFLQALEGGESQSRDALSTPVAAAQSNSAVWKIGLAASVLLNVLLLLWLLVFVK